MNYNTVRSLELLQTGSQNPHAEFREGQEAAIQHLVESTQRLLVIQKTGWGKSFVYFIATKLLREVGKGPVILISPLLSLMRNQIEAATRMGVKAFSITHENDSQSDEIQSLMAQDQVDILIISPERLSNLDFKEKILNKYSANFSMLVIDEAHCISDWGHDFRPDYRLIERILKNLPPNLRVLATTATANQRVMNDLVSILGPNITVHAGDLNRSSLTLQTIELPTHAEKLAWLINNISKIQGSGIIYTLTKRDAYVVTEWLKLNNIKAEAYTSTIEGSKEELENSLINNELKVLVATVALGMGFDKPDLAFVIHYQMPSSIVAYYQQVGRAGRAIDNAYGILLSGDEDDEISNWFIDSAFPKLDEIQTVLQVLEDSANGLSVPQMLNKINMSKSRIEKTLQSLTLEHPSLTVKNGSKWYRTPTPYHDAVTQRANRLTVLRKQEQEQMHEYVKLPFGEHMRFLIEALDGDTSSVQPPKLPALPEDIDSESVNLANSFLHRTGNPIKPRSKWPDITGMPKYNLKGQIPNIHKAQEGIALSVWGDAGWAKLVKKGRYEDKYFDDALVHECVKMFKNWNLDSTPHWVTCIPSMNNPDLVPNFAQRLAEELNLPFIPVLTKTEHNAQQKSMANQTQQALNVDGTLAISTPPLTGPVLLVDDIVNSGWTFTVAAWLLRSNGSGNVLPLALATTGY
ncbi:RecQ family ATP-dependent DNA helicase [Acinetobacter lwoffii]|uniref:DNA 3'-5' helicase n=1 Tax=Acinetobacter lwoffii TaxID=28090 RepID=A0AAJ4P4D3_ACILW|nr:RecQ family ATP-dependent DNA helicase [Acinetobacter lwoffii]